MPIAANEADARERWDGDPGVDFGGKIADSPTTRGFHEYFGVSASLDMAPYVFIRDDHFTMKPTIQQEAVPFPHFIRKGPRAKDFVVDEVLDRLAGEAVAFIEKQAKTNEPFFLYLPFTAPHKPTQPHKRFQGKTRLADYGDFVVQVDWTVGHVLETLDRAGVADNTLVIFTSDNGSYMHRYDNPTQKDHVDDVHIQGFRAEHHRPNGPFRGTKADIWEAGHHVPFFVRWPGHVQPGTTCDRTVCLTDLFATCAEVTGASLGNDEAEDSLSLWSLMQGKVAERGAPVIHHSANGLFAIREGKWKLVLGNGSGGREKPRGKPFEKPYYLFDMQADVGETTNLIEKHPEIAQRLEQQFRQIHDSGRTVTRKQPVQ